MLAALVAFTSACGGGSGGTPEGSVAMYRGNAQRTRVFPAGNVSARAYGMVPTFESRYADRGANIVGKTIELTADF